MHDTTYIPWVLRYDAIEVSAMASSDLSDRWGVAGIVYFLQPRSPVGLIKIGYSDSSIKRAYDLQAFCPDRLELLTTFRGSLRDEQHAHWQFRHLRQHSEWFVPGADLLHFVARLRAGELPWPEHERDLFVPSAAESDLETEDGLFIQRLQAGYRKHSETAPSSFRAFPSPRAAIKETKHIPDIEQVAVPRTRRSRPIVR